MILAWLIIIPLLGGLLSWLVERWSVRLTRWVALIAVLGDFLLAVWLWARHWGDVPLTAQGAWMVDFTLPWIPQIGASFHLGLDGISLLLVLLTGLLGIFSVAASWLGIRTRVGLFHFNLLWTLAGIIGVFLALDLVLFYAFWEIMLVPLYFLIDLWGHEERHYAALKFFIFTQTGGLFLLLAILGLYFMHGANTGDYTFDYFRLLGTTMQPIAAFWLMFGFFVAFAVKLPAVPLHTWLPDAHTQAPVAGSVDLAGLVLKVGAYGMLRFLLPLFPEAARSFTPVVMTLAVVGILYGAILAFAQTDLKRLVAYTSISHMGFVLLGIFAWNPWGLQGAMLVIICHGISTGALFILVGMLDERVHTRDMDRLGGLWSSLPHLGGIGMFLAMASLGLPGLGNFIGEFLVLLGTYQVSVTFTVLAALGFILSVIYALWIIQRVFHGPPVHTPSVRRLSLREGAMMFVSIAILLWLGLYPQAVLNTANGALRGLQQLSGRVTAQTGTPGV
ncbi:MAG TPA: NADH-quinone oxidoreductase subunit M, partial [Armatimonadota bacterium]